MHFILSSIICLFVFYGIGEAIDERIDDRIDQRNRGHYYDF